MEKRSMPRSQEKPLDETDYLLSSPENARRLRESIKEFGTDRMIVAEWNDDGCLVEKP